MHHESARTAATVIGAVLISALMLFALRPADPWAAVFGALGTGAGMVAALRLTASKPS